MGHERHPAPVVAELSATAGLVPVLKNPDFGVARAMDFWAPHGGLHRQGNPARQGRRRPGDAREGHPLIPSDETEIARPVFS